MADLTNGLLQGLQQGLGSYLESSERRKDRELRQKELEDASSFRKQNLEAEFFKSGLLPKYDPSGKLIGADVNEAVMKAKNDSDPIQGLIKGMQLKNMQTEQEEKARGTEGERKAVTFAKRTKEAEDIFNKLEQGGYDRSSLKSGAASAVSGLIPMVKSTELGQQEQAERNFINAILRRESGAAISPSEFENASLQYFPRVGDTPEVLAQKKANRQTAIEGLAQEGGRAMKFQGGFDMQQSQASQVAPQDQKALDWAQKNPQDPRAKAIMQKLGM